jgi:hypothetical protein
MTVNETSRTPSSLTGYVEKKMKLLLKFLKYSPVHGRFY